MPNIREEITKRFLWLTTASVKRPPNQSDETSHSAGHPFAGHRPGSSASLASSSEFAETIVQSDAREGQQFGVYRIIKRLGSGGMGHVYLALDTRLGRHVALKFLPPELTSNTELLHRFQQEARTASALNHPNILVIYDIGEVCGEYFIAGEFVDGTTLRAAMDRQPIDVRTAIDIASQVASALVAAHAAGVVHRDLKPSNIMIRPDGYIKVIDFGLAKRFEAAGSDSSANLSLTRPGSVVGTLSYMSPEQARGDPVDLRTDLWSLGVILYEMVVNRRPFEGETESHVIVSILDHPPAPLPTKSLPAGLPRIIERALAKDRAKRYQTAAEMLADLQHASRASDLGSKVRPVVVARPPALSRKWLIPAIIAVVLLALAIWWWPLGGEARLLGPNWFHIESVRQLTFNGRAIRAAISPDGNYLAFAAGVPNGPQALYVKQVNSLSDAIKIPTKKISYVGVTFSPDDQIFVVQKDDKLIGELYSLPILGDSSSPRLVTDIDGPVTFSPDGSRFAFVRNTEQRTARDHTESAIFIASRDGFEVRKLVSVQNFAFAERIAWSPKGDVIAAIVYNNSPGANDRPMLDLIDLKGRQKLKALPNWRAPGQLCWSPGAKTLVLTAVDRDDVSNRARLRELDIETGQASDITHDWVGYRSASLTKDGQQLAAIKIESEGSLWVSAIGDFTKGQSASAEPEEHPTLAWPDPSHLLISSYRGGVPNLWAFDVSTQARRPLTNDPHVEQNAVPIPGSNSVVVSWNGSGQFHLWRFDPDNNRFTQLTFGGNYEDTPSITPDGQWIVYTSWNANTPHLWMAPVKGGKARQVTSYPAQDPQISPDGKSIACTIKDPHNSEWGLAVIPLDGSGEPRHVPDASLPLRWWPDGSALTSVRTDANGVSNIWRIPLDGSPATQLTQFADHVILNFAWSPNGDRLACVRASLGTDVALFTRQRSK